MAALQGEHGLLTCNRCGSEVEISSAQVGCTFIIKGKILRTRSHAHIGLKLMFRINLLG